MAAGTLVVALGLTVTGAGTIGMMAMAARAMSPETYAAFAVWWTVATLLGTSFGVFEAYLARLLIGALSAGHAPAPVVGLMLGRAALVVGVLAAALLGMAPLLSERLFADSVGAAVLLPLFTALAAMQALQRGAATGRHDFRAIAAQLSTDGVVRVVLIGLVVAAELDTVATLGLACITAAAVSLLVAGRRVKGWLAPLRLRGREAAVKPLVLLLIGSIGPLLANNGSVPWLAATDSVDAYTLGAFAGAVTLSRIPTQFVSAVFSPLLAHLAAVVDAGDDATFRHLRRSAESAAAVLGVLYVGGFAVLGPWILSLYLGPGYRLGVVPLALLAAASSGMFIAVVQQAGLSALDQWWRIAWAWIVGTIAFCVVLIAPVDTLMRAAIAPVAGVASALLAMALLGRGLHARARKTSP
jgi:O-antigen/teichoic acid export membrane protein